MGSIYTYPHVNFSVHANPRRLPEATESTATTLLAPFTCDRGPENELIAIDSFADFQAIYGPLDYSKHGQRQILNIGQWLSDGGRVLACRITDKGDMDATAKAAKTGRKYYAEYYNATKKDKEVIEISVPEATDDDDDSSTNLYMTPITSPKDGYEFNKHVYAVEIEAKYTGTYYNGINIEIKKSTTSKKAYNINIIKDKITLETYRNKELGEIGTVLERSSSYLESFNIETATVDSLLLTNSNYDQSTGIWRIEWDYDYSSSEIPEMKVSLSDGTDVADDYLYDESIDYDNLDGMTAEGDDDIDTCALCAKLNAILQQPLETPFDCMIDCGYPAYVKVQLLKMFCIGINRTIKKITSSGEQELTVNEKRDDAFLYLSTIVINGKGYGKLSNVVTEVGSKTLKVIHGGDYTNVSITQHYEKVDDIYSYGVGAREVYVPTLYYMAGMIPSADATRGPQYPLAGTEYGVLKGIKWIDHIPTNIEKQELYNEHINYVEKDSRCYAIMTQLTATNVDTALIHVSKSRALLKIVKDLKLICRKYLHQFNDRLTKSNLQNALNSYISNWVQNRTLSYADIRIVDYTENPSLTNEELLVSYAFVFTNTVEIISNEIIVD